MWSPTNYSQCPSTLCSDMRKKGVLSTEFPQTAATHPWDYSVNIWASCQPNQNPDRSLSGCFMHRILLRLLTLPFCPSSLRLSLEKLERIHPTSSSGPLISHNHMLRPNVSLSCQLSRDRNTEDSCDSGQMALETMWRPSPNGVLVTEAHWEACRVLITMRVLSVLKCIQRVRWLHYTTLPVVWKQAQVPCVIEWHLHAAKKRLQG